MKKSTMHRVYWVRFACRMAIFFAVIWLYAAKRDAFSVLQAGQFFARPSALHLLWLIWCADMVMQLIPCGHHFLLGSEKQFGRYFRPAQYDAAALRDFVRQSTLRAVLVFLLWTAVTAAAGLAARAGLLESAELLVLCVLFYVGDLVCVLFWCPFQTLLMKNRCCSTCRIFNWDHLMMVSPLLFVPGFFGSSLLSLAILDFLCWEIRFFRHPERFWEGSNAALRCASCQDALCRSAKAQAGQQCTK
ncbi:MAG: hypothetical protein PHS97_05725 [Oscillospiraceae bacterium]|nr:hypothetical protein [Oscillospiraceae bacterium]